MEIKVMARRGISARAIARELGISRNTVAKYLHSATVPRYGPREPRRTKLDPYKDYLQERIASAQPDWIPATVLLREIQEQGYDGGISQLKEYIRQYKPTLKPEPLVRFETKPGEQMQVDFVVFRRGSDRLSAFVSTLGYSRVSHVSFVTDEKIDTVIACLREAFTAFGGVPRHVLFDNMKTAVLERDAYGPGRHRHHGVLLDLSKACGFSIRLCRPYRAKTKGKVERFNRYLRNSFWIPLKTRFAASGLIVDAATANEAVGRWLRDVANVRQHGELRQRPIDRFEADQEQLLPYVGTVTELVVPRRRVPPPIESIQHPLSMYDALLTDVAVER